jgi:hypothetical protein
MRILMTSYEFPPIGGGTVGAMSTTRGLLSKLATTSFTPTSSGPTGCSRGTSSGWCSHAPSAARRRLEENFAWSAVARRYVEEYARHLPSADPLALDVVHHPIVAATAGGRS